jgi:hypothetical protein
MTKKAKDIDEAVSHGTASDSIKVISLRQGDIVLPSQKTIKCKEVVSLSKVEADWLVASFPDEIKVV